MRPSALTRSEQREYQEWLDLCERIRNSTEPIAHESEDARRARVARLKGDFAAFCKFYFEKMMDDGRTEFGWFHKEAARKIAADKNCRIILEWPREHAKSVFADIFVPLWLWARGELTGAVVASANQEKAAKLLGDLQAQFVANRRFIEDYGDVAAFGSWRDSYFATSDGCGFWAFGRDQSPRGIRELKNRPNYFVVDDIDDKTVVRNQKRVSEYVDWVIEDLYGAGSVGGARLVVAGNRIHKASILARLVGDVEPGDPKRAGWQHVKVFALEDKKRQKDLGGQPAWRERYTAAQIHDRIAFMGHRSAMREYFHEHHEEGNVFKNEWLGWEKPPAQLDEIVFYLDPSWKGSKDNDYKAMVVVGKARGGKAYVLDAWVRQASVSAMVKASYDLWEKHGNGCRYFMEANFMQDLLMDDFEAEGAARGRQMPLRADKRKKDAKEVRIENLSPLFERGWLVFDEAKKASPDFQALRDQLLGFPYGHDDGPDALESAVSLLQARDRSARFEPRIGRYNLRRER